MFRQLTADRVNGILNPPLSNRQPNPAHMAYLRWLQQQNNEDYTLLRTYRDYYAGEHNTQLTRRLRAFLRVKPGTRFSINFMKIPVDVLKERLTVEAFEAEGQTDIFSEWMAKARLDGVQKAVHSATFRDGRTFVIVGWDNERNVPTFSHNLAYDGDYGVKVAYDEDDPSRVSFAAKIWKIEQQGADGFGKRKRLNFYAPDAIYKYVQDMAGGGWVPYAEYDAAGNPLPWPIPWVDAMGQPLGVPVFGFYNNPDGDHDGISELHDLIGPQNIVNKQVLDLLAAADVTGFGMRYKVGGSDPGNVAIAPGTIAWDEDPDTTWGTFPPSDLTGLRTVISDAKQTFAQISRVPLSYFQVTGQIASAETQKADDTGLVSKVEDRAVNIGNSWEDCMYMARKLANVFGGAAMADEVISVRWASFERVDKRMSDRTNAETAKLMMETFIMGLDAGLDRMTAALRAGYGQEEAETMAQAAGDTLLPQIPEL